MTSEQIFVNLKNILEDASSLNKFKLYKSFRENLSPEFHRIADLTFDFFCQGVTPPKRLDVKVVALIHGIRTQAAWQVAFQTKYHTAGDFEVYPLGYGFFDLFRFLSPERFRKSPIKSVTSKLMYLQSQFPEKELMVVTHSFGTYIMANILKSHGDINVKKIILCGSIIPVDYDWIGLGSTSFNQNCVNDVGTKDYWPIAARVFSFGYGPSGSFGFKNPVVRDRYFPYGHSDFFRIDHYDKYWIPFLRRGEIITPEYKEEDMNNSYILSILGSLPYIKIYLLMACFFLLYLFV